MLPGFYICPACQKVSCFDFASVLLEKGEKRLLGQVARKAELSSQPFVRDDLQTTAGCRILVDHSRL